MNTKRLVLLLACSAGVTTSALAGPALDAAQAHFEGKTQVNVRYVLTYRDSKLVNETWQVDPKPAAGVY